MASGRPSTRSQMPAIAGAFSFVAWKSGLTATARSMKSRTASNCDSAASPGRALRSGSASGGTGNSCSPETRNAMRLLTSTRSPALPSRSSVAIVAASSTCSKLSSTSSVCFSRRFSSSASIGRRLPVVEMASACAIADGTRSGSWIALSGTKYTPSGNWSSTPAAICRLRRVLPVPPGPVSVSNLDRSSSCCASRTWSSRPMKLVNCVGRLFGVASSVLSAGNSESRPSTLSWKRRSGRAMSLSRCRPRSFSVSPGGNACSTSARVVSEIRTWPPWPALATRAARCTSRPRY